jgi:eukaryotic-like serine/threonine-protein kinase
MNDGDRTQSIDLMVLGRYRLQRRIGKGGMGEVWLADDPRLHRQVAIKTLPFHTQGDSEFLQRFEGEARAAAALNHPHILPVHDYGEQPLAEGQAITYIVMPYVEGGTLADRVKQLAAEQRAMPLDDAIDYLSQAAEAIDYAHEQSVMHRDIKPSNMLLRKGKWLLLADFGIARILSDQQHLTQAGVGVGTPEYMAPEQAQGKPEAASDNYSLAVIAYQLFTGQLPFHADTPYATTIQHMTTPPPPPRQINPNIPPAVEQVLLQGLAKDPAQRPPTARAFVTALKQAASARMAAMEAPTLAVKDILLTPPSGEQQPTTPQPPHGPGDSKVQPAPEHGGISRRQVLVGGGAAALLVAGGLGAWALISRSSAATKHGLAPKPTPNPDAPVMTLLAHTSPISSLAWSPASPGILASAARDSLTMLWDIPAIQQGQASTTSPQARQQFGGTSPLLLGWSPDGKTLAIGNANAVIDPSNPNLLDVQVDVYEGDLSKRIPQYDVQLMTYHQTAFLYGLCWGPSHYLVTVSKPHQTTGTGEYLLEFRDPLQPQKGLVSIHQRDFAYALAAAPDGQTIAVGTSSGVMIGQEHGTGRMGQWKPIVPLLLFNGKAMIVGGVTWSPDGKYVAAINNARFVGQSFSPTSLIAFWDWQNTSTSQALSLPNTSTVLTTLAWCPAPSSTLLAAGSKDGSIYLWNVDPQHMQGNTLQIRRLTGLQAQVTAFAWSIDGRWLAAGYNDTNNSILLWKI